MVSSLYAQEGLDTTTGDDNTHSDLIEARMAHYFTKALI
jgi:hypothetical protein